MLYMQRERERLDQMERERLAGLAAQKAQSSRQQTILVIGAMVFALVVIALVVVVALLTR